jgi:fucose 4-O-acetylase-like acetyltransferase
MGIDASSSYQKRDIGIDILKTIGILCVILAHTFPSKSLIFQIRNFDVPLMVIASGTLFYWSSRNKNHYFWSYLKSRLPRLLAPIWVFTVFYFSSIYVLYKLIGKEYSYTWNDFFSSLILIDGISYFWITRVFILVAILAPLLLQLYQVTKNETKFLLTLLSLYTLYEAVYYLTNTSIIHFFFLSNFVQNYAFYGIPYACLFGLGMVLPRLSDRAIASIAGLSFLIYLGFAIYSFYSSGQILSTQALKYPPRLYYFSYGVSISTFLYFIVQKLTRKNILVRTNAVLLNILIFISQSSFWIYLWHIFFLEYWPLFANSLAGAHAYISAFLGITLLSISTTFLQKWLVTKVVKTTEFGQRHSNLLTTLFLR